MSENKSAIRLSHLTIKNYKKIASLAIDFPRPLMADDADILVLGSKNGGGKTSVLECCALLIHEGIMQGNCDATVYTFNPKVIRLLIKAGEKKSVLIGEFNRNNQNCKITLSFGFDGIVHFEFTGDISIFQVENSIKLNAEFGNIFSFFTEPVIIPPLLHFNSYRRVRTSNPELGMMVEDTPKKIPNNPISSFKMEVVNLFMSKAGFLRGVNQADSERLLAQLNQLVQRYCGGQIIELNPQANSTFEILITPTTGGESFSFDGLSSGQKEIIATLFLIWKNTQHQPSIVLIDEPELHLNAEWHRHFVKQLHQLAPQNQYILATHSERIFGSVDKNYRGILEINNKEVL